MEEKKENKITHAMRSGLVLGGLFVARDFLSLIVFKNIPSVLTLLTLAGLIIPLACIFHFTKKFDREVLTGKITYPIALSYGFYMFFFAAMIIALFSYIYFQYINPDYLAQQEGEILNFLKQYLPEETVKTAGTMTLTSANTAINGLWVFTFLGFIACLFTSLYFRKKKNNTPINNG